MRNMFLDSSYDKDLSKWKFHKSIPRYTVNRYVGKNIIVASDIIIADDKNHLNRLISQEIKTQFDIFSRFNILDLNHIDVANVNDLSELFYDLKVDGAPRSKHAYTDPMDIKIDVSKWNVSNVTDMRSLFDSEYITVDGLENWDVSNVKNMSNIFYFKEYPNNTKVINTWKISSFCLVDKELVKIIYGVKNEL